MATIYSSASAAEIHEEDRDLVEMLARLQSMHNQVFQLRKLLPERLIGPLKQAIAKPNGSASAVPPAMLARKLVQVAGDGRAMVQHFKKEWRSDDMHELFDKVNTGSYPQGDDTWRVDYSAITNQMRTESESARATAQEVEDLRQAVDEDPKEVVKTFMATHRHINIQAQDEGSGWPVDVKIAGMGFRIDREQQSQITLYRVAGKPGTKGSDLAQDILGILATRKDKHNLSNLLEMLASYHDVRTRPCDKCHQVFDNSLQLAVVKVLRGLDAEDGSKWLSLHRNCA